MERRITGHIPPGKNEEGLTTIQTSPDGTEELVIWIHAYYSCQNIQSHSGTLWQAIKPAQMLENKKMGDVLNHKETMIKLNSSAVWSHQLTGCKGRITLDRIQMDGQIIEVNKKI